jgi:apolipoprotein N-acyltransferase
MKYIISIILGLLSVLSFSPYDIKPLIVIGLSGLLIMVKKQKSLKDVIYISFLYSIAFYFLGTWWLFTIEDNFSSILVISFGTIALMSAYLVLANILIFKFASSNKVYLFIAPLVLTIFEILRGILFTGFTWLSPSHAFLDIGINSLYPLIGIVGINLLVYIFVSIVSLLIVEKNIKFFYILSVYTIAIFLFSYFFKNIEWTKKFSTPTKSIIIQTNTPVSEKTTTYEITKRLRKIVNAINTKENIKYVILPESTISIDYDNIKDELLQELKRVKDKNVKFIFGAYKKAFKGSYNALLDNNLKVLYIKNHLIPFGEYTPKWFESISPKLPMNNIVTKKSNKIFTIEKINFAPSICYELLFPNELRDSAKKADVLLHVSELGWFANSWAAKYLETLARIESIMYQKALIYSVNSGYSAYIDKDGTILNKAPKKGFYLIEFNLTLYKGFTPYSKFGYFSTVILFAIWCLFLIIFYKGE